jgi:uncharacterized protein with ATP-grasp and redox domains
MGQLIHRLIREETDNPDPYKNVKNLSTSMAIEMQDSILKKIKESDNKFESALRYAIAGNILDFALLSLWDKNKLPDALNMAESKTLNLKAVKKLENQISISKNILYLGDNAGETVFDKIFINQFKNEKHHIYYSVKSKPIINDAVYSDALDAGIDKVAEIIENGTDAPGTVLNQCSAHFISIFNSADLIISKGQANFETLNEVDKNIFFLTQIKCPVIGNNYGYKTGEWVVWVSDQDCN